MNASIRRVPVSQIGREEWWEYVTVTGRIREERGRPLAVVSGQLLRVIHYVHGDAALLIGPPDSAVTVIVDRNSEIIVEDRPI